MNGGEFVAHWPAQRWPNCQKIRQTHTLSGWQANATVKLQPPRSAQRNRR